MQVLVPQMHTSLQLRPPYLQSVSSFVTPFSSGSNKLNSPHYQIRQLKPVQTRTTQLMYLIGTSKTVSSYLVLNTQLPNK